jgi:diphosphomevalonate decarboxylase
MKITVESPANIAFVKYWGMRDPNLFIPMNNHISMNLSGCMTTTTIEPISDKEDIVEVEFYGKQVQRLVPDSIKAKNIFDQIDRIRNLAGSNERVKILTKNNFPADAGIASSASGFSALTAALLLVYGMKEKFEDKVEFSRQIRLCGSGSATRSAYGGFAEYIAGTNHDDSYAVQIANENHWDLVDIIAVVDPEKKKISSSEGHSIAGSSAFLDARLSELPNRVEVVKKAILDRDIRTLGPEIERDSTSLHVVMMTSNPPAFYWAPGSVSIMKSLMDWREEDDLQAYFTLDAGANVHVICEKKDADEVTKRLEANPFVKWTIYNEACEGTKVISIEDL